MRKKIKQYVSMLMVMLMAISAVVFCGAEKAYAGSFSGGYISLGADLTSDEKAKVLALFGVLNYSKREIHCIFKYFTTLIIYKSAPIIL